MASYRRAITWIVANDDTTFLHDGRGYLSVTASLVADVFNRTDEEVRADLLREELKWWPLLDYKKD